MPVKKIPATTPSASKRTRRPLTAGQRTARSRANAAIKVERFRTNELGFRDIEHEKRRLETARHYPIERYKGEVPGRVADKAISTATPSDNSGIIMTIIFTMAGLILFYKLVTRPTETSGFVSKSTNWLAAISTNTPLFKTVQK